MGTANRAYGTQMFQQMPYYQLASGLRTDLGTLLPPGGVVQAYVRSTGVQDGDPEDIKRRLYTDINAALALCRSGMGDAVVLLPGHTENVDAADDWSNLVAGTHIIGMGSGNDRPTFTWTTATSTVLFNVANVSLSNCILKMCDTGNAGVTVAAPITVSAAGCSIVGNRIVFGADADDIVTIGITTTAAADDFVFAGNLCTGATTAECTTFLRLVGTDRAVIMDNYIEGATSSTTVGVLQMLTTAPTNVWVENCIFVNRKAASVHAATGMAAATGVVKDCAFGILDNATAAGWETEGNLMFFNCTTTNNNGENSIAKTPQSV